MKVLYLADDLSGATWYRCHVPGAALKELGHDVVLTHDVDREQMESCDVLVLQRMYLPTFVDVVPHLQDRGVRVVYDIDDDYWNIRPENPAHAVWADGRNLDTVIRLMRASDVVTVATTVLAERLRARGVHPRVLRNMLPPDYWPSGAQRTAEKDAETVVVGWTSSGSHRPDVAIVGDVMVQMLDRYPHVEFHVAGLLPEWLPSHPRIVNVQAVPIERYGALVAGFDIGIAPLLDNRFNQAKSDLKLLEYGICGLPVVASPVGAYNEYGRHRENLLFAKNAKDWIKHLSALIEQPELRGQLGSSLGNLASSRLIAQNIGGWLKAYGLEDRA